MLDLPIRGELNITYDGAGAGEFQVEAGAIPRNQSVESLDILYQLFHQTLIFLAIPPPQVCLVQVSFIYLFRLPILDTI